MLNYFGLASIFRKKKKCSHEIYLSRLRIRFSTNYLPKFFDICEVELFGESQNGTQIRPKIFESGDVVKHHFRDRYKTRTANKATNPATAPKNAVASTGPKTKD